MIPIVNLENLNAISKISILAILIFMSAFIFRLKCDISLSITIIEGISCSVTLLPSEEITEKFLWQGVIRKFVGCFFLIPMVLAFVLFSNYVSPMVSPSTAAVKGGILGLLATFFTLVGYLVFHLLLSKSMQVSEAKIDRLVNKPAENESVIDEPVSTDTLSKPATEQLESGS